jgi:hypothetical protein
MVFADRDSAMLRHATTGWLIYFIEGGEICPLGMVRSLESPEASKPEVAEPSLYPPRDTDHHQPAGAADAAAPS